MDDLQSRARAAYLALGDRKKVLAVAILEAWALDDAKAAPKEKKPKKTVLTLVPRGER